MNNIMRQVRWNEIDTMPEWMREAQAPDTKTTTHTEQNREKETESSWEKGYAAKIR